MCYLFNKLLAVIPILKDGRDYGSGQTILSLLSDATWLPILGEAGDGWSSVRDVSGKQMRRMRWRIGQDLGLLFILPVGAGQPLTVLPQMLFPGGDNEELHKAVCCLAIAIEPPLYCPGP